MRIGILTGGGDVPGLNTAIQEVTRQACRRGWEVLGIRRGWAGLLAINPDGAPEANAQHLMPLDTHVTRGIDRTGGTILHSARLHPDEVPAPLMPAFLAPRAVYDARGRADMTAHILRVIEFLGLDALVPLGGDGTLGYAARLDAEGVPVVAIPKTMDNDVPGTEVAIGFPTAVTRAVRAIHDLRGTASAEESICVIELMGRHCGETALISGWLGSADRTAIAEVPVDVEMLARLLAEDARGAAEAGAVLVVSEGARMAGAEPVALGLADDLGRPRLGGIGQVLAGEIARRTGIPAFSLRLAYLMRAGAPVSQDQLIARAYATLAVECLEAGSTGRMAAISAGLYEAVPVSCLRQGSRRVDADRLFDAAAFQPVIVRPDASLSFSF